ncbi:hypothetical protein H6G17_27095 [Chroococcidiopsis sp. FACHB-1243]|uniref:hypothetical protein n=1 Tax=Chroococcidiopsis sp. [FACHB-1243] TaxID=2692781 RepID=UPI00177BC21B|nr:hypothetical protein [Chroococcidiopsis sp. [FACHB-1243]]MBD2309129.1 hypothetical protein [Chroococcidiopsis sp. [FACHB-1243]]
MLQSIIRCSRSIVGTIIVFFGMAHLVPAIATAPAPPQLVSAKLNGQAVYVLYLTRSSDKVLVRCYPGQQPKVEVQAKADGTKEGILTCGN